MWQERSPIAHEMLYLIFNKCALLPQVSLRAAEGRAAALGISSNRHITAAHSPFLSTRSTRQPPAPARHAPLTIALRNRWMVPCRIVSRP